MTKSLTNVHNQVFVKNLLKSEIIGMASKVKKDENPSFYNYGMTFRHTSPEINGLVRYRTGPFMMLGYML